MLALGAAEKATQNSLVTLGAGHESPRHVAAYRDGL
jgi:hypothetical protein